MNNNSFLPTQITNPLMQSDYLYFIRMDIGGDINLTNRKFQNHLFPKQTVSQAISFSDYLYPRDYINYQILLKNSIATGQKQFLMELRKIRLNGDGFHWTKWEFSISEDQIDSIQISAIGHDIQKKIGRKKNTTPDFVYEYQVKNEIIEGLFDDNLIGYWIWDIEKGENQLNISFKTMLGYNGFQDFRKIISWKKHIHQDDQKKVEARLQDHFNSLGKTPFHCDFRIKTLKGLELWVIGYGKVIRWDKAGKPLSMVGCFFDISEKKKAEFLLERQSVFLKNLTFNQSHLMRSKLANIIGVLEIMDISNCSKEVTSYINIINKEAKKLDEVLKESINTSSALDNNSSFI